MAKNDNMQYAKDFTKLLITIIKSECNEVLEDKNVQATIQNIKEDSEGSLGLYLIHGQIVDYEVWIKHVLINKYPGWTKALGSTLSFAAINHNQQALKERGFYFFKGLYILQDDQGNKIDLKDLSASVIAKKIMDKLETFHYDIKKASK